jgi:hypothetical protein
MKLGWARRGIAVGTRCVCHGALAALLIGSLAPEAGCTSSFVCADNDGLCSDTTELACSTHTGCSWASECLPPFCDGADLSLSKTACLAVDGCVWDGASSPACTTESIPLQCSAQPSQSTCSAAPHCHWAVGCIINVSVQCSDAQSQTECDKVGRCSWVETGPNTFG